MNWKIDVIHYAINNTLLNIQFTYHKIYLDTFRLFK